LWYSYRRAFLLSIVFHKEDLIINQQIMYNKKINIKYLLFVIMKTNNFVKTRFIVFVLLIVGLVLVGASCSFGSKKEEKDKEEKEESFQNDYSGAKLSKEEMEQVFYDTAEEIGWSGIIVQYSEKMGYYVERKNKEGSFYAKMQISNISDFSGMDIPGIGKVDKSNYVEKLCNALIESKKAYAEDYAEYGAISKAELIEIQGFEACYSFDKYQEGYLFESLINMIVGDYEIILNSWDDYGQALDVKEIAEVLVANFLDALKKSK